MPPIGLWTYNYWNKKKKEKKKFGKWLYKSLSSPPVLISDVNPDLRAQKIQNDLFDMGYFQTRAWATVDTSARNPKKAKIKYTVELSPPSHYNLIELEPLSGSIDTMINLDYFSEEIKTGDQFNLAKLKTARDGLTMQIQDQGYFYFTPEIIQLTADTTIGDQKLNLILGSDEQLPPSVLSTYEIGQIHVYITRSSDTSKVRIDTVRYDDVTIYSTGDLMKDDVIRNAVFLTSGELYSYQSHQGTNSRLNSLGVFRYVRQPLHIPQTTASPGHSM